ncbi:hypothetical protein E4U42_004684 [Claviceps africana]|uniref:Serine-rich protein n=1 Tax=Claviceps africana TaxID=83212 RepID=A0A8K0JBX4_9HYPO|nr:hypothetical protein E4U42_004684 [Claviceps africana]
MPASPAKHGKALNHHESLNPDRLQIRVVPYTPPRLSTDGDCSASTCPPPSAAKSSSALLPVHGTDRKGRDPVDAHVAAEFANTTNRILSPARDQFPAPPAPVLPSPSSRRANRVIAVNSDKTFSLLRQASPSSPATNWTRSPRLSPAAPSSSIRRADSDSFAAEQPTSPPTTLVGSSQPYSGDCTPLPPKSQVEESPSPWNYQLIGGLRKVPNSASSKTVRVSRDASFLADSCSAPDWTPSGSSPGGPGQARNLASKQPLNSSPSTSTLSEADYNMPTLDSPCPLPTKRLTSFDTGDPEQMPPSPAQPNVEVLDESSSEQSSDDQSRPRTAESHCNYVLHQDSTSASPVVPTLTSQWNPEYSRESLVVAPLRPARRHLANQPGLSRRTTRDSLGTRSSTSVSSAASVEIFAGNTTVSRGVGCMEATRRQSSSMLSAAVSESERSSDVPSSPLSHVVPGNLDSEHASHAPRAPGVVADVEFWQPESWIERPQRAYVKPWTEEANSSSLRLIGNQDEHGDGLAELGAHRRHPSRSRLHNYLSGIPSDRNLRSAGSSHSNSFSRSYIPMWARLYYGSGERRLLSIRQSSESLYSNFARCAHHSPMMGRSASFQSSIADKHVYHERHSSASAVPRSPTTFQPPWDNIAPIPPRQLSVIRRIRKQTSSIWSPHLRRDRRAPTHSIWRPPSIGYAARENKLFRDRIQLVLFVLGFVFPFAWMAASFLPLPSRHGVEFGEKARSTSHLDLEQGTHPQRQIAMRAACHDRERWWRTLNRYMSVVGVFVIGAVLALSITGNQQQWK